ncbi:Uma2 family endonuclease [Brevundimonas sp. R86498]|uniref:Uma2 family endonuclease n=1 Tax=Brevundimonas sp. R86498 TaxID=3093845 RepID=UPI0037CA06D4
METGQHRSPVGTLSSAVQEGRRPFLFDFDAFERMEQAGIFSRHAGKVELIEGRICDMAPLSGDHTDVTSELHLGLGVAVRATPGLDLKVLTQGTLRIGDHSAPEPDIFVARSRGGRKYYEAADAVLVIEVSVSTVEDDRRTKVPLYARAGIPELWIAEPEARLVRIYRGPRADGSWISEITVTEGGVSPLFAPEIRIALADVFGGA